jgi:hypothetical protein
MKKEIVPVAVGQIRIDPDERMACRKVEILEIGLTKKRLVYDRKAQKSHEEQDPCVLIQRGGSGPKVKTAVRRIETWPLYGPEK